MRAALGGGVTGGKQVKPPNHDAVGREPGRHARCCIQAANAQPGADEQRNRQRDLRGHQPATQAMPSEPAAGGAGIAKGGREVQGAAWTAGASAKSRTVPMAMAAVNQSTAHR